MGNQFIGGFGGPPRYITKKERKLVTGAMKKSLIQKKKKTSGYEKLQK